MTNPVDEILANRRRAPSMGQIITTAPADGMCTVLLADGEVDARLVDHMLLAGPSAAVVAGDVVVVLPIGDTYLVVGSVGSSAGSGGTAPSLGTNLLPNPGFEFGDETSANGWGGYPWISEGVTVTRDTSPGESVSGSARSLQSLPAGTDVIASSWTSAAVAVDSSVTYRASAWVKASSITPDLGCEIWVISGSTPDEANLFTSGTVHTAATVASPGSAYQLMFGDVTIPAGHDYIRMFLRSVSDHASPLTVSWDEAAFQQRIT